MIILNGLNFSVLDDVFQTNDILIKRKWKFSGKDFLNLKMLKICIAFIKKIKWLCENLFNEKLEMTFCNGNNEKWEPLDEESMKKNLKMS